MTRAIQAFYHTKIIFLAACLFIIIMIVINLAVFFSLLNSYQGTACFFFQLIQGLECERKNIGSNDTISRSVCNERDIPSNVKFTVMLNENSTSSPGNFIIWLFYFMSLFLIKFMQPKSTSESHSFFFVFFFFLSLWNFWLVWSIISHRFSVFYFIVYFKLYQIWFLQCFCCNTSLNLYNMQFSRCSRLTWFTQLSSWK